MVKSLQRLDQVAKPDSFGDQKSASEISSSEASSSDYADFQEAILSQIKRIIHGNRLGRWHSDVTNNMGHDISLATLYDIIVSDGVIYQVDLQDNRTEYITVGDAATDRKILIDYSYEMPISERAIVGTFLFNHDGTDVEMSNDYTFIPPEPSGVDFSAVLDAGEIKLKVVTNGVGENPTLKYRKKTIGVV